MRNLLTFTWFGLAIWFLWDSNPAGQELRATPLLAPEAPLELDRGFARSAMSDPPAAVIGGIEQRCSACHALFESLAVTPERLAQHTDIALDHGLNDRCFNCHDREDRNKLVLRDGALVGFDDSTTLCSQCHGTLFRDWERGMHGKTLGSWDADSGEQVRGRCVDCHDPHAPAFGPIAPLPGPRTRGYRPPAHHGPDQSELENPLERWKRRRPDPVDHAEPVDHSGGGVR